MIPFSRNIRTSMLCSFHGIMFQQSNGNDPDNRVIKQVRVGNPGFQRSDQPVWGQSYNANDQAESPLLSCDKVYVGRFGACLTTCCHCKLCADASCHTALCRGARFARPCLQTTPPCDLSDRLVHGQFSAMTNSNAVRALPDDRIALSPYCTSCLLRGRGSHWQARRAFSPGLPVLFERALQRCAAPRASLAPPMRLCRLPGIRHPPRRTACPGCPLQHAM
jgi:hypothetical protein